jgi:hypothetical protein
MIAWYLAGVTKKCSHGGDCVGGATAPAANHLHLGCTPPKPDLHAAFVDGSRTGSHRMSGHDPSAAPSSGSPLSRRLTPARHRLKGRRGHRHGSDTRAALAAVQVVSRSFQNPYHFHCACARRPIRPCVLWEWSHAREAVAAEDGQHGSWFAAGARVSMGGCALANPRARCAGRTVS